MQPLIDRAQVIHVAKLARLTLADDEVPLVTEQLVKILGHIAQLAEVNTTGIAPTTQVGVDRAPLRADLPQAGVDRALALAAAPQSANDGFVVPSFVED